MNTIVKTSKQTFNIQFYSLGNGTTVVNRAKEIRYGEYEKLAHISDLGEVHWYANRVPKRVEKIVQDMAEVGSFSFQEYTVRKVCDSVTQGRYLVVKDDRVLLTGELMYSSGGLNYAKSEQMILNELRSFKQRGMI
jgi:hypothetical protein